MAYHELSAESSEILKSFDAPSTSAVLMNRISVYAGSLAHFNSALQGRLIGSSKWLGAIRTENPSLPVAYGTCIPSEQKDPSLLWTRGFPRF